MSLPSGLSLVEFLCRGESTVVTTMIVWQVLAKRENMLLTWILYRVCSALQHHLLWDSWLIDWLVGLALGFLRLQFTENPTQVLWRCNPASLAPIIPGTHGPHTATIPVAQSHLYPILLSEPLPLQLLFEPCPLSAVCSSKHFLKEEKHQTTSSSKLKLQGTTKRAN